MSTRLPISAFIIAKNEADRIPKAIRSVRDWVDEVIVIDGGSHTLLQGPLGTTDFSDGYLHAMDSWLSRILR